MQRGIVGLAMAGLLVCGVNAEESKDDPLTRVEQLQSRYLTERKCTGS